MQEMRDELMSLGSNHFASNYFHKSNDFGKLDSLVEDLSRALSQGSNMLDSKKAWDGINRRQNILGKIKSKSVSLK